QCLSHAVNDAVITRAATQVAGHQLANAVRADELGMVADPARRHHNAGRTRPALRGAAPLERLERARVEGLDGRHAMSPHLVGGDQAGVHRQAVQVDGAGAALALVARATAFTIAGAGPSIGSSPSPLAPPAPCGYGFSRNATRTAGTSSDVGIR